MTFFDVSLVKLLNEALMEKIDKATYTNILDSINNIEQWALMRVMIFVLCLANVSLAVAQMVFTFLENSFYLEYFVIVFMGYWIFQFSNALPFYIKLKSDVSKLKKIAKQDQTLLEQGLSIEEHMAYIKEREGKGLFASIQRQLVVNTYHYNIGHLIHNVTDFSNPVKILKLPESNIVVGLQQESISELNETELDILNKIHQGLADKKIARELKYTPSTIRSYNSRIFKKLGVKTRKEAVSKALQIGLLK